MSAEHVTIHPSAIVDEGAQIGKNSRIWHFTHVCSGAQIGEGCSLGQNVFIGNKVTIGNYCKIQNNVSVYDNVHLEEGVFCGPSMVFTNVYNPRSLIERKSEYQNTWVKKGATLGANCTIICGTTIGAYAFIGAGAVVNKDVPDYALMVGVPAKQIGWMSEFGEQLDLPLHGQTTTICPHTHHIYQLNNQTVVRIQ
ncbi:UDP-2-acetamido-3-amino-2,3-dideoxy-D-glucuronate N-acetyltransferase [Photorhabdus australis subsp. thailandensis]|uniref:UDP-2-acetamido-3-amino-2, 3-dideoxy-D-glucuronate N-acetyltransferase n=1 Tax=Photorhabdus australis subsp. thailandensis TaxID=2805096 RepID=A0A1C0U933_9GAMM|nr:acyltransferase [Photorhabdus australis]OCQ54386.1 UDP-2-acetamido-3-amino-2,3-dideoxy-D-glucuronate N-acetyltransferase [Photorhabdus australis subsp. thailandensis]